MSTNTVQPATSFDQLTRSLLNRFDGNKDGQLTTEEFTAFLSQFLSGVTAPAGRPFGASTTPAKGLQAGVTPPTMNGFDARKLADVTHTTIKYQFARVAQQYSLDSVIDKASGEALLASMKGDLEAAGVTVLDVKGDKIKLKDDAGQEAWIDVIQSCSIGKPAWQWLDTRF